MRRILACLGDVARGLLRSALACEVRRGRAHSRSPRFADAVLITPYNVAVYHFGQQRALNFAMQTGAASFWIQATDAPPSWFASGFSEAELVEQKKKWLSYHARKTEGILSLLLACVGMPYRVTDSNGAEFKEYGVHNGAKCVLKAWQL